MTDMFFHDWILPGIIGALLLYLGLIWALLLRRKARGSQAPGTRSPSHSPLDAGRRQIMSGIILILGGALFAFSSQALRHHLVEGARWLIAVSYIFGFGLILVGALEIYTETGRARIGAAIERASRWMGLRSDQFVILAISPFCALFAGFATNYGFDISSQRIATVFWGLGIVLAVAGAWERRFQPQQLDWRVVLWSTLILAAAFLVRGLDTGHIPRVLSGDEGSFGLSAARFVQGETHNLFENGSHSFPSLYFFLQSISISVLDQTSQAIRITSAFAGALTVACLYLLGRAMYGNLAGLTAAIFLAGLHFHIHFSRLGVNNVWDGLWYVVTLGALWHAWRYNRRASFLLAGLGLGFGQYFYASARTLFALVPLWLLIVGWMDRQHLKKVIPGLVIMGIAAVVVYLPLAGYYLRHPDEFMGPYRAVTFMGARLDLAVRSTRLPAWRILIDQVRTSLQAYVVTPTIYWYKPGTPMLRPVAAALFLLGLSLLLVKKPRDPRTILLGLWLFAIAMIGALSESTPAAQRYIAATPALALVIGYALQTVWATLAARWTRPGRSLAVMTVLFTVALAGDDLRFYFLEYTPGSDFGGHGARVAQRLADTLQSKKSGDWQLVYIGDTRIGYHSIPSLRYLTPHVEGLDIRQPWGSSENPEPDRCSLFFVFLPESEPSIDPVSDAYPGGRLTTELGMNGELLYWSYEVRSTDGSKRGECWAGRPPEPTLP